MSLYFGSNKVKINLNSKTYCLNILTKTIITEGALLLSLDNYILQDNNGLYLTIKEND